MKTIQTSSAICATLAVLGGLLAWSTYSHPKPAQAANPQLPVAPELVGSNTQWLNTNGKTLSLDSRRGKVTIVEFFDSSSADSRANLPTYKQWATKWDKQGVEVIGINTPQLPAERDPQKLLSYARENSISFPILFDTTGANWKRWQPRGRPTIYVVDGDGQVRYRWEGALDYNGTKGAPQVENQIVAAIADTNKPKKIFKTEDEWQKILPPMTFEVLRHAETENAFSGDLWDNHQSGIYRCAGCGLELFSSNTKFESGTGWPSFYQTIRKNVVEEKSDYTMGMERTEVVCARCGGHLGHVFNDGPRPTGLRYCMNSAALSFQKSQK